MFAFDKPLMWVIILVIVLLIFGAGKLPEIGKALGTSIKEFKSEAAAPTDQGKPKVVVGEIVPAPASASAGPITTVTAANPAAFPAQVGGNPSGGDGGNNN